RPCPPSSTLFPYTTLFRSTGRGALRKCRGSRDMLAATSGPRPARLERAIHLLGDAHGGLERHEPGLPRNHGRPAAARALEEGIRSEEHTSELQSLAYLVCR